MSLLPAYENSSLHIQSSQVGLDDFDLGRTIGKGRFARVRMAKFKAEPQLPLCIKIMKKSDMRRLEQLEHILNEKDALASSRHPFIIHLLRTFQDALRLYMTMELVNGGELFTLLRRERTLKLPTAKFYVAEAASAISYLHEMLVVYRDIKPENILIHRTGHIKLTDFGFAKYLPNERTTTICGTPAYMAPEIIKARAGGYGLAVDWWSIGILTFELLSGKPPFDAPEEEDTFQLILRGHASYPPVMDKTARDFIMRLLVADPGKRLGNPANETSWRTHKFLQDIDWDTLEAGNAEPPWRPDSAGDFDITNFQEFEESTGGGGIDSGTGSVFVSAPGAADPFATWGTAEDLRPQALLVAKGLREKRQRKREEAEKAREAEAQELDRLNKEFQEKQLKQQDVKVELKAPESKGCCSLQ